MDKKTIIISAINFSEGGPLTIYKECLKCLEENFLKEYKVVALVHDKSLFSEYEGKIEFIEFKGTHFFINEYCEEICAMINNRLLEE